MHITADARLSGLFGRQEERHIDIAEIDHIHHTATGTEHFTRFGNAILNTAVARRFQLAVIQIRFNPVLCRQSGIHFGLCLDNTGLCGINRRRSRCHLSFRRFHSSTGTLHNSKVIIHLLNRYRVGSHQCL